MGQGRISSFLFSLVAQILWRVRCRNAVIRPPQVLHVCALVHDVLTLRTGAFDLYTTRKVYQVWVYVKKLGMDREELTA